MNKRRVKKKSWSGKRMGRTRIIEDRGGREME
jgi:hypothetical protein